MSMQNSWLYTAQEMSDPNVTLLQVFGAVSEGVVNIGNEGLVGREW